MREGLAQDGQEPYGGESDFGAVGVGMGEDDESGEFVSDRSLFDDIGALIEDGKTYAQAEFGFQKTRVAFTLDRAKSVVAYGAAALLLLVLALIGLTVGLIIALTPWIGPWGATALVVGLWLVGAALLARRAMRALQQIQNAFSGDDTGAEL